jgi:predicted MFS family arabinose efflux permease
VVLGLAAVLAVAIAWALGADLVRASSIRLRATFFVFLALALQLVIFTRLGQVVPAPAHLPLHIASYGMLVLFLALNGRNLGLAVAAGGLASNLVVILANGGRMPISAHAWKESGRSLRNIAASGVYHNNTLAGGHPRLAWLGDVFPLPLGRVLGNAVSLGDLLVVCGLAIFVYRAGTTRARTGAGNMLAPLRCGDFTRLLVGRSASRLGDWLTMTAVVTWAYAETHRAAIVALFLALRMVAVALGGIAAAPRLDRLPRARILALVEVSRGAVTLAMLPLAWHHAFLPVILLACLSSFLGAATNPSASSLIADLLPPGHFNAGNALNGFTRSGAMVAGTVTGALVVNGTGIGGALLLDVATFAASSVLYLNIVAHRAPRQEEPAKSKGPSRTDFVRIILADPILLGLTASFTVVTAAMGLLNAALPVFLRYQLGASKAYGYALGAIGAGLMCGELLTGLVARERVARRSVGLAFAAMAGCLLVAAASGSIATAYLMLFLIGASDGTTETTYDTLFQRQLQANVRAGVFALAGSVQTTGMIVGLSLAPLVASSGGAPALRLSALACLVGAVIAAASVGWHLRWRARSATPRQIEALSQQTP